MKAPPGDLRILQLGVGLIGKFLAPLVAQAPQVKSVRLVDRDAFTRAQVARPGDAGRPKAQVVAEAIKEANPNLCVDAMVAEIENLPLALFRCDVLFTPLDSRRARMVANFAFCKLAIPYWIDCGISAPNLVRVSIFASGKNAPCYECRLGPEDYNLEQSYPCQGQFVPPPTNAPAYLGALAAGLTAAELNRLVSGKFDPDFLNLELVYDTLAHQLVTTRLVRQPACRMDHTPFKIRPLSRGPGEITLAETLALGANGSNAKAQLARLEVPGKLFVRDLVCPRGHRRSCLRLKGRLSAAEQTCPECGEPVSPLGSSLTEGLARSSLGARELGKPLSSLGLEPAEVISVGNGRHCRFFELPMNLTPRSDPSPRPSPLMKSRWIGISARGRIDASLFAKGRFTAPIRGQSPSGLSTSVKTPKSRT